MRDMRHTKSTPTTKRVLYEFSTYRIISGRVYPEFKGKLIFVEVSAEKSRKILEAAK